MPSATSASETPARAALAHKARSLGVLLVIAGTYAGMMALGITCPIKFFTGVSCPGCGMTRALLAALRLDWSAALAYHPLFWAVPLAAMVWLFDWRLPQAPVRWAGWALGIAFLLVYLFRLLGGSGQVVVFAPREGLIGRVLLAVFSP